MASALVIINSPAARQKIATWAMKLPWNTRVLFKEPKRTLPQNDKMHAMITDVSQQVLWHGIKLSVPDWKLVFMDALNRELRMVPNIDGTGFVNLGRSTAELSKAEMIDMIELISAFGANHGVVFQEPKDAAA